MDKAARAQLMRDRFRAVGGIPYVATGKTLKPVLWPNPDSRGLWRMDWPEAEPNTKRAPGWMLEPDAKPKPVPRPKRRTGKPALIAIAEQAPGKLRRRYVSAEGLLAERAPR